MSPNDLWSVFSFLVNKHSRQNNSIANQIANTSKSQSRQKERHYSPHNLFKKGMVLEKRHFLMSHTKIFV